MKKKTLGALFGAAMMSATLLAVPTSVLAEETTVSTEATNEETTSEDSTQYKTRKPTPSEIPTGSEKWWNFGSSVIGSSGNLLVDNPFAGEEDSWLFHLVTFLTSLPIIGWFRADSVRVRTLRGALGPFWTEEARTYYCTSNGQWEGEGALPPNDDAMLRKQPDCNDGRVSTWSERWKVITSS
ncbi:MAG: hypothetical protein Q3972_03075 [Corynebacterium sp.]|nr:hypothetical protein [Corynebacterium sp.]